MTVINLPRDDQGTQSLREANADRRAATPISPVSPSSRVSSHSLPCPSIPVVSGEERRRGERRYRQERRGRNQSTLLDTRSHHERRTHERRQQPADEKKAQRPLGINVYI